MPKVPVFSFFRCWRLTVFKFASSVQLFTFFLLNFFYSTCCGQGTWSLLQRKVRKAKETGLRMSKYVQTEPFRNQHDQSMIRCTAFNFLPSSLWYAPQIKNSCQKADLNKTKQQKQSKHQPSRLCFSARISSSSPPSLSLNHTHCHCNHTAPITKHFFMCSKRQIIIFIFLLQLLETCEFAKMILKTSRKDSMKASKQIFCSNFLKIFLASLNRNCWQLPNGFHSF